MTCAVYIICVMQLNSNSVNRQNFKSKIARHFCEIVIFIGTQEGFQAMTTSRSSKCPPAVPKRGPDTRLSSTSSSSESSVFSLQVTLQLIAHNSHSVSAVLQLWHYSWLRTTLTQFQPYYSCDITADCAQLSLSFSRTTGVTLQLIAHNSHSVSAIQCSGSGLSDILQRHCFATCRGCCCGFSGAPFGFFWLQHLATPLLSAFGYYLPTWHCPHDPVSVCMSVTTHKLVFCWNVWTDRVDFWHRGLMTYFVLCYKKIWVPPEITTVGLLHSGTLSHIAVLSSQVCN